MEPTPSVSKVSCGPNRLLNKGCNPVLQEPSENEDGTEQVADTSDRYLCDTVFDATDPK